MVFFCGPPYEILKVWQSGGFELIVSPEILNEYRRVGKVLAEEHPNIELTPMLKFFLEDATVYGPPSLQDLICDDPVGTIDFCLRAGKWMQGYCQRG